MSSEAPFAVESAPVRPEEDEEMEEYFLSQEELEEIQRAAEDAMNREGE